MFYTLGDLDYTLKIIVRVKERNGYGSSNTLNFS